MNVSDMIQKSAGGARRDIDRKTDVSVLDLMVLSLLDDSKNLLLDSLSFGRRTSNSNGVSSLVGRVGLLVSDVNDDELLLPDHATSGQIV
jgi:hypothetical protein